MGGGERECNKGKGEFEEEVVGCRGVVRVEGGGK